MHRHHLIQSTEHPSTDKHRRKLHIPSIFIPNHLNFLHNIILLIFFKLKDARVDSMTVKQPFHHVTHAASVTGQHDDGVFRHGVSDGVF
ncbi:hypothetical protein HanRHA438_Chr01g0032051 [Helianthus annuus]|nr:hypothetical protein HanRHA438_Chr01g0032051 [Helianthus annuus]